MTRLQATIDRQKQELVKYWQKVAEYEERHSSGGEDENTGNDLESQDEEDIGFGARAGSCIHYDNHS